MQDYFPRPHLHFFKYAAEFKETLHLYLSHILPQTALQESKSKDVFRGLFCPQTSEAEVRGSPIAADCRQVLKGSSRRG